MSSSLPQTATNAQSLNGILTLSDGIITIENGVISGLTELDLINLQVSDTATIENLVVNNQIDMTLGQIKNVAAPTENGDSTNKQYVDTNFLNKTSSNTQSISAKLSLTNATTDIFTNPIIQFTNTNITPLNQGQFIRFLKGVSQQPNLEIGGLSFCSNNFSTTLRRQADLICSMNSNTYPEINLKFNDGTINPLTINYGNFISRNDKQYFLKQDGSIIFNYLDYLDYVAFAKDISLGNNNIINLADPTLAHHGATKAYVDSHSANNNYLLRSGILPMTGNLQMGDYKITNLLEPDDLNDGANKYYVDTQTANTHYVLRNGSLSMTGNLNLATHNLTTTGDINCNDITADGNLSCADFNSAGNQTLGTNSSGSLNVKSSSFFDADMLVNNNYHLMLGGNPASTGGMRLVYDSAFQTNGTAYFDARATSLKIRLTTISNPTTDRIEINNSGTTIKNNLIVDGNTTLGNFATGDTLTCNCQAKFPNTSKLTFEGGSILSFDSGAEIHGFRVKLKSMGVNYTISSGSDLTNDGILCTNQYPDDIIITMPARSSVWNNRKLIIKTQTGDVKIRQATGTYSTTRNNSIADYDITTDYLCKTHIFDSDFGTNGKIWSID